MNISPGDNLGPYRVIEPLGQGGMATVYKAYHAALDRYVAIKVLHPAFKEDPNFLARFKREARIVAKLDHPNIVPIYDFDEERGMPYLVMRYIDGKTLKTILRQGAMPVGRALSIIRPVAEGLAYAHTQGILHRDIKPSNIILASDQHIFLTDFGLARIAQASDSTISQDMLIGTPQYISPEQARGVPATERSDIYSLGVVLFEMLTGRVPFSADTPYAIIHDHIYSPLPLPSSINPGLPKDVERVLLKALAKDPAARYTNALELLNALYQAAGIPAPTGSTITPVPALPPDLSDRTTPPPAKISEVMPKPAPQPQKNRWLVTCGVIGAIVILLLCGVMAINPQSPLRQTFKNLPPPSQTVDPVRAARDKVTANPQDPVAHVQLAEALMRQKDFAAAFAEFDQAIRLNPASPGAYLRAGEAATRINDYERATRYFQAGLNIAPDDAGLLLGLGDLYFEQKKFDEARAQVEKVLKADAGNAQALWRLGDIERAQGKIAEALRDYSRAVAIEPNLPQAHYGLGMLALNRGQTDEAKRQFQMVVNNPNTPPELKDEANKQLKQLSGK
jgi:serine/threonine-protein kinase